MYNDSMTPPCYDGINCPDYCDDIDECYLNRYDCPMGKICVNTWGSYRCECTHGLKPSENGCIGINLIYLIY